MILRHKFDENMKDDNKLLITGATFGFCLLLVFIDIQVESK